MNTICDKSFCDGKVTKHVSVITIYPINICFQIKGWGVKYGNIPPSPRMTTLINGHGKGFNVYSDQLGHSWLKL